MGMVFSGTSPWWPITSVWHSSVLAIGLAYVLAVALLSPKPWVTRMLVRGCTSRLVGPLATSSRILLELFLGEARADDALVGTMRLVVDERNGPMGERDAWSYHGAAHTAQSLLRTAAFVFYPVASGGR